MKRSILFVAFLFAAGLAIAQKGRVENKSGVLYFAFGSHDAYYTKSDIHFKSDAFDFTLKKVKAVDDEFLKATGGAAQYDYQVGYYFKNKKFGIEYNFDHVKYFARHDQTVRTVGTVNGQKIDEDLPITTYVQNFEHSNGGNYVLLNFVKWKNLAESKNEKSVLDLLLKAGGGIVLPKTNSEILHNHRDDKYKIAGYVFALEGGLRYVFFKNFFIEPSAKGAFANYTHFLIANGRGNQHWFSAQFLIMAGAQINL